MEVNSKRVDHLGIVAGTIKNLGIIELIDSLVGTEKLNVITTGEAVAAMVLNGLGYSNRVLTLTPQFYETKAMGKLFREGVESSHLNRFKLGRALDKIVDCGIEKFFTTIALSVCIKEKVDLGVFNSDVTAYALSGKYDEEMDLGEVLVKHGFSKDHRPDLKQVVQGLASSNDGGVPVMVSVWPGNTSDVEVLREQTNKLLELFSDSTETRCLIGDSKLYVEENIRHLNRIKFITRVPATIKREAKIINETLKEDCWRGIDSDYKACEYNIKYYGVDQRWIVVHSEHALKRARKTVEKIVKKEYESCKKALFHLQSQRFSCETDAIKELEKIGKKFKFHTITNHDVLKHARHKKRGRPTREASEFEYQIIAEEECNKNAIANELTHRSCFVLATNLPAAEYSLEKIIELYKSQDMVEKNFRFLKNPSFFASSLYLKNQKRLQGLLAIMTLALLIYSIAQRHLRKQLALLKLTVPNQIGKPTSKPTLRWIFQIIEGINLVRVKIDGTEHVHLDGITEQKQFILELFYPEVQQIYGII